MLNYLWFALIFGAVVLGGLQGQLKPLTEAAFESAKTAVMGIALPLVGLMALWLGFMRLAEKSGLILVFARGLRPVLRRLFPEVPPDHPAMGAMLMNIAANMLGLANAATPLGLRAMADLERLNPHPGTATNAMCMFLAVNTSSVQLIPTTAIGILAAAGSTDATAIIGPALIATLCSTLVGIAGARWLQNRRAFAAPSAAVPPSAPPSPSPPVPLDAAGSSGPAQGPAALPPWGRAALAGVALLFAILLGRMVASPTPDAATRAVWLRGLDAGSLLAIPFVFAMFPLYALLRRVKVYEEFVEGAKEGFQVGVRIIPFLVAMLVAVGMFRAAGGIDLLARGLGPGLNALQVPPDLLPMILVRPLSGGATTGLFAELVRAHGPDSMIARMGGAIFGSTETTFYVIAVYFGAVGVHRVRHAIVAGLAADAAGVVASMVICRLVFG